MFYFPCTSPLRPIMHWALGGANLLIAGEAHIEQTFRLNRPGRRNPPHPTSGGPSAAPSHHSSSPLSTPSTPGHGQSKLLCTAPSKPLLAVRLPLTPSLYFGCRLSLAVLCSATPNSEFLFLSNAQELCRPLFRVVLSVVFPAFCVRSDPHIPGATSEGWGRAPSWVFFRVG